MHLKLTLCIFCSIYRLTHDISPISIRDTLHLLNIKQYSCKNGLWVIQVNKDCSKLHTHTKISLHGTWRWWFSCVWGTRRPQVTTRLSDLSVVPQSWTWHVRPDRFVLFIHRWICHSVNIHQSASISKHNLNKKTVRIQWSEILIH